MFAIALVIALLAVVAAKPAIFSGKYSDPNHPGCAREIGLETATSAKVFGADAAGGEGGVPCDGTTDVKWGPLPATIDGFGIVVDFSSKGGPSDLSGKYYYQGSQIKWQDGNAWTKLV
jgi:hypothetical protein